MIRTLVPYESDEGSLEFVPPLLTRDVYDLHVGIMLRGWSDAQLRTALAHWCARFVQDVPAKALVMRTDLALLAYEIAGAAGLSDSIMSELRTLLDVSHGADEYDPKKDEKPCGCPKCAGVLEEFEGCKFEGVTDKARAVSAWSFLAAHPQLLDAPFSLYQIAVADNTARGCGQAASRQKRQREEEAKAEAKRIREKHGHRW